MMGTKMKKISIQQLVKFGKTLFVTAIVAIPVGIYAQAESNSLSIEVENGAATGGVTYIDSTLASGGKFAQFNQTGGGEADPYANIPSNFDTSVNGPYRSSGWTTGDSSSEPTGNFRVFCRFSHLGYYDPILAPGNNQFMHLHMFFGNTQANHQSTYSSLRSGGNSTCSGGPINRSAYWMPTLHDQNGDVVVPHLFIVYYKSEQSGPGTLAQRQQRLRSVVDFPNGFRYIGGRNPTTGQLYSPIEWKCEGGSGSGSTIPNSCPSGESLIGSVRFPHCWDGENLWLPNNAHVGLGVNNSTWTECDPNGPYPVYLPSLTEFAHFPSTSNMSNWYLSSDRMDPNPANWHQDGRSWHADWFGAWDNEIQSIWIEQCLRGLRNSNAALCDGSGLRDGQGYSGPNRISGYTPLAPIYGNNGWPVGQ